MLAQKNETIKQGIVTLKELAADEKVKMQLEAREQYYRDLNAILDYEKQEKDKEIHSLQSALQQAEAQKNKFQEESAKFQEESAKFQEESAKKDEHIRNIEEENAKMQERLRLMEEQLAKTNQK